MKTINIYKELEEYKKRHGFINSEGNINIVVDNDKVPVILPLIFNVTMNRLQYDIQSYKRK